MINSNIQELILHISCFRCIWTQSKMVYVMLTFENIKINFLNRMKYIEGTLVKSSGKISREHKKLLVRKKVNFKVKCDRKDAKVTICCINIS